MAILNRPTSAAKTAILYITVGALLNVWSGVRFVYLNNHDTGQYTTEYYWCAGLFLSGITLLIIGLALGRIGRAARHAELPPEEVTAAAAQAEQNAAARAPVIAPVNPALSAAVPGTTPVAPTAPVGVGAAPIVQPVRPARTV